MTLHEFLSRYLLTLHGIVVALGLFVYVTVARSLPQRRDPSAAVAWVVALVLVPYLAVPLYLLFGSRKLRLIPLGVNCSRRSAFRGSRLGVKASPHE